MPQIHPTAVVDARAELGDDVEIGPYVIIQGHVVIGAGAIIHSHSVVYGHSVIGRNCRIGPSAYIGMEPQHRSNAGVGTSCYIGDETTIRETAQVNRATRPGPEHATRLGARCFLMAGAHVGHDCQIGDDVTMANAVLLGGHVTVGERVFFGGGSGVHQFCRIGRLTVVAGIEQITRDVPPFAAVRYGGLKAYNAIGCRRFGLDRESIQAIRGAYRCLHSNRTIPDAIAAIRATVPDVPVAAEIIAFATAKGRGLQPSVHFLNRLAAGDDSN
ncbi:MAG TPA: acyl-ACP--UDP-N-acetylglucosamine O-acyltransferase [Tepidisphaeraceae bacterium]|nr:acyl-ACP--UDP-N-acetylglucosamine O-acyltransferase [Tepidisphaeraceae bacterium]